MIESVKTAGGYTSPVSPESLDKPTQRFYRPELDWLRFLAFLMVFTTHSIRAEDMSSGAGQGVLGQLAAVLLFPFVRAGVFGVDVFFILSAYLITELLLLEYDRTGAIEIPAFYARRALRIWPLYYTLVVVVFPIEYFLADHRPGYYLSYLFFLGNWRIDLQSHASHLWSVCVEEQFYLVWPLALRYLRRRLLTFLLAVLFVSVVMRTGLIYAHWPFSFVVQRNTFARMDCFAIGGIVAYVLHGKAFILSGRARIATGMIAAFLFWAIGTSPGPGDATTTLWCYPVSAVASVLLLLLFLSVRRPHATGRISRLLSYLGKISYGLYMWHPLMLGLVWWRFLSETSMHPLARAGTQMVPALMLTVGMSMLSYGLLEKPFLRLKRRFTLVQSRAV